MTDRANDDGPEQAPADWYDDPSAPGRMRYFDGQSWTNHYHEPGKLPAIGNWINTTFSVFGQYWRDAALLAFVIALIGNVVTWVGLRPVVNNLAVVDEELINATTATVIGGILLVAFSFLWQGIGWLAMSRFMQRAHFQAEPSVTESLRHALGRLPRYLLFMITLGIAGLLVVGLVSAITVVAPALGLFLLLLALVAMVWIAVKLAFLIVALAIGPLDVSPISASADVSAGRFWPVLGRLVLLVFGLGIVANLITASLGDAGQFFDAQTLSDAFEVRNDELVVRDFRIADLLPSSSQLVIVILANSIIQAASNMVSASAFVRLYLDSGGDSEL